MTSDNIWTIIIFAKLESKDNHNSQYLFTPNAGEMKLFNVKQVHFPKGRKRERDRGREREKDKQREEGERDSYTK